MTYTRLAPEAKKNGVVYTPTKLADYVAGKLVEYFVQDSLKSKAGNQREIDCKLSMLTDVRVIDPACGDGELLLAVWKVAVNELGKSVKCSELDIEPEKILCGVDINQEAVNNTKLRIKHITESRGGDSTNIIQTDALIPFDAQSSNEGWEALKERLKAQNGFDLLIANPPWGADIEHDRVSKLSKEFVLLKGQYDSSDLFLELAMKIVKPRGYFAFIIPDSLFAKERLSLRKMLLEKTEIKFIGRFGEKIFPNINRACAVLVCKNEEPHGSSVVDCLRLSPQLKKDVLQGEFTFKEAESYLLHRVSQTRFKKNKEYAFNIYLRAEEERVPAIMSKCKNTFRDYLINTRGVELSKSGRICQCQSCEKWVPLPRSRSPRCRHCGMNIKPSELENVRIISKSRVEGFKPILVGENVDRYITKPPSWIAVDKPGIQYKNMDIFQGPKIVVRKTGIGILAAIDYENMLTNQVVYIFKAKDSCSKIPLEILLALLNSRAMYYYLVKGNGETEWRSHPYLTQDQLLNLPVPATLLDEGFSTRIENIVVKLKIYTKAHLEITADVDSEVERLIADLYGLSISDYEHIFETLQNVQQLLPVRRFGTVAISDIFNERNTSRI